MKTEKEEKRAAARAIKKLRGNRYAGFISDAFRNHPNIAATALKFATEKEPEPVHNGRVFDFIKKFISLMEKQKKDLSTVDKL